MRKEHKAETSLRECEGSSTREAATMRNKVQMNGLMALDQEAALQGRSDYRRNSNLKVQL
jgi:hypothetical protein